MRSIVNNWCSISNTIFEEIMWLISNYQRITYLAQKMTGRHSEGWLNTIKTTSRAAVIALLTVGSQAIRGAVANPVKSLRDGGNGAISDKSVRIV